MASLVIGGAGYIGSHMVKLLLERGEDTVILDNLNTGFRDAVHGGEFVTGDCGDIPLLHKLFRSRNFDAVFHFASSTLVGESVTNPGKYYRNNLANTISLLEVMIELGPRNLVFSSTAAVYGEPVADRIREDAPCRPVNPYGRTKHAVEDMLADFEQAHGLKWCAMRYFNAAGADPEGCLGERHEPETHLIPLVLQAASGRRGCIRVFGREQATPDGTCIRDYVHVDDLCEAHWLALERMKAGAGSRIYNLGNATPHSVMEVIAAAEVVTGRNIAVVSAPARPGDPGILVADSSRVRAELGWRPRYADLHAMIGHAWQWELQKGVRW